MSLDKDEGGALSKRKAGRRSTLPPRRAGPCGMPSVQPSGHCESPEVSDVPSSPDPPLTGPRDRVIPLDQASVSQPQNKVVEMQI